VNLDHVFVCGNSALDFAATLRARRAVRFEMFATPDRLDVWFVESGIVDAVSPSQEADVQQATAVREAIYQLVTVRRLGEEYDEAALAVVNGAACRPPGRRNSLRPGDGRRQRQRKPSPR
jgi:hypothetical protein